jgi:hypothetical protein
MCRPTTVTEGHLPTNRPPEETDSDVRSMAR